MCLMSASFYRQPLGLVHLTDDQLTVADVDGDGRVTLMDAEILAAKIIGSD